MVAPPFRLISVCRSQAFIEDAGMMVRSQSAPGKNLQESLLTPAKVNVAKFGHWTRMVTSIVNVRGGQFIPLGDG
jgi:hypothetical protein